MFLVNRALLAFDVRIDRENAAGERREISLGKPAPKGSSRGKALKLAAMTNRVADF